MPNGPDDTNPKLNIEPQSWTAWLSDPVTQEVLRALRAERADWSLALETGRTLSAGQEIALTGKAVGAIYGLDYVLVGIEEMLRSQWNQAKEERLLAEEPVYSQERGKIGNGEFSSY